MPKKSDAQSPSVRGPKPTDETVKETLESIIVAFALAFVFRAYIVEAFVIPTGSMAPTLLGQHLTCQCEQCGYTFKVDASEQANAERYNTLVCPMCFYPNSVHPETRTRSGDRILVQKYLYGFQEPDRWDVVVFKNPRRETVGPPRLPSGPRQNYIKRLVGLPNEQIALLDGNVYVRPRDDAGPWRIARKTDPRANRRWEDIQRTVFQPIYHTRYVPLDGGTLGPARVNYPWRQPWRPAAGQWDIDRGRFHLRKAPDGAAARLVFDFDPMPGGRLGYGEPIARYAYDQSAEHFFDRGLSYTFWGKMRDERRPEPIDAVEDIRLAVAVSPQTDTLTVRLRTTARLDSQDAGPQPITLQVTPDGVAAFLVPGHDPIVAAEAGPPLRAGQPVAIEMWYVDQELRAWINGRCVLEHRFDWEWEKLLNRPAPAPLPSVAIELEGGGATVQNIELDRDLYYTAQKAGAYAGNAGFSRTRREAKASGEPFVLHDDEFFVIGDNGPISEDGRFWQVATGGYRDVHPWVEARMFADDGRNHAGRVPRRLMMGRAFFVYYPAPYPLDAKSNPKAGGVFPNFGDMRLIY